MGLGLWFGGTCARPGAEAEGVVLAWLGTGLGTRLGVG